MSNVAGALSILLIVVMLVLVVSRAIKFQQSKYYGIPYKMANYGICGSSRRDGNVMTTTIEGELYLVALRHSNEMWILLPCKEIGNSLHFKNDRFLICSLSKLDITPMKYARLERV